jgi:hypothetical protein
MSEAVYKHAYRELLRVLDRQSSITLPKGHEHIRRLIELRGIEAVNGHKQKTAAALGELLGVEHDLRNPVTAERNSPTRT